MLYGSVVHRGNDIFGRNVALAARVAVLAARVAVLAARVAALAASVAALAEGGQILVSEPVAESIAGCNDLLLVDPRSVALKGLPGEHTVTTVDWRG